MSKPPKQPKSLTKQIKSSSARDRSEIAELATMMERLAQMAGPLDDAEIDGMAMEMAGGMTEQLSISVLRLPSGKGLPLPARQSDGASGLDLCAAVAVTLAPGARALVPTGFAVEIPPSFEAQVRPRSGLAVKHGVTVLNSPGTIDSDYRGEIGVILINHGSEPFTISRGDRIAQLVFGMIVRVEPEEVAELERSKRGSGGFGSTGTRIPKR